METNRAQHGSKDAINKLCRVLRISPDTGEEMVQRGLLHFDGDSWRLGDENNGSTRRLYGNWKRADNSGPDWHKLIGLDDVVQNDRRNVVFVIEGNKDALAAAEIAHRNGILPETGIICALGSGYRPIRSELEQLRGRQVLVVGDNDAAGIETTEIVCQALEAAGVDHKVWDWTNRPEKDLYDFLSGNLSQNPLFSAFFSSFSPSHASTLLPFYPSTTETVGGLGQDERLGIVAPFIVAKRGTGNAMSFQLARAVKQRNLNMQNINIIFKLWFEKSRPMLPPDADESQSLQDFYRQLGRVRFTDAGLEAACERARTATPPFIPARDGDIEVAKLAALCRELQRNAGNRPFICSVNVAQRFLGLRWASQANYLLHILEDEKVLECADRGAPNKPGVKGKPTMWRYKFPIE
jgi:hypothetical protein